MNLLPGWSYLKTPFLHTSFDLEKLVPTGLRSHCLDCEELCAAFRNLRLISSDNQPSSMSRCFCFIPILARQLEKFCNP